MPYGITPGSSGIFTANLIDNGLPVPSSDWVWSSNDANATITTQASDPSGATVQVAIPAADTSTSITLTASAKDADGKTQTATYTVPIPEVKPYWAMIGQVD